MSVTGNPRVRLEIGERNRWARYSGADGATLTFAYKVKKVDADGDGVSIGADQLQLNGGSIADADGNAAVLSHPALAAQSGHQVDGSPEAPAGGQEQQPPANSAPQFAAESASRSVDEDAEVGAKVGDAIAATDADGDALTYAVSGSDAFAIGESSGQITVAASLDYEKQSSHSLTVTVSDGRNASGEADAAVDDTIAVTASVGNVDEPGVVSLESENDPPQVGGGLRAVLLDPDGVTGDVAWTWERSADGESPWSAIDGATGASYTATADDAGYYLRAVASYADGHGPGKMTRGALSAPTAPGASQQLAQEAQVSLRLRPEVIGESGGLSVVTATLDTPVTGDVTVTVSAAAVSPAVAGDFRLSRNQTLTIRAGATESIGLVTITAVDNSVSAANKTVTVSGTADNVALARSPANATLTIAEDDHNCANTTATPSTASAGSGSRLRGAAGLPGSAAGRRHAELERGPGHRQLDRRHPRRRPGDRADPFGALAVGQHTGRSWATCHICSSWAWPTTI